MKKFLTALVASVLLFSGQVQVASADNLNEQIETQEISKWAHIRDKYILGRETDKERRARKEWERKHHRYYPPDRRDNHRYYTPPPPPPYYRNGKRYYPPPAPAPPPYYRDGERYYPPSPPPTRYR